MMTRGEKRSNSPFVAGFVVLLCVSLAHGETKRVKWDSACPYGCDGSTWAKAYKKLGKALAAAKMNSSAAIWRTTTTDVTPMVIVRRARPAIRGRDSAPVPTHRTAIRVTHVQAHLPIAYEHVQPPSVGREAKRCVFGECEVRGCRGGWVGQLTGCLFGSTD